MHTGTPQASYGRQPSLRSSRWQIVLATVGASNATPTAAVQDPERTPRRRPAGISGSGKEVEDRQFAQSARRQVVDVNVDSVTPLRFSAVLVRNSGPYARTGLVLRQRGRRDQEDQRRAGRLIDLEPFTLFGKRFFAYVWSRTRRRRQGLALGTTT